MKSSALVREEMTNMKGNFIDNLPKVYGIYTGGFLAFIIIMSIGEQMGMSAKACLLYTSPSPRDGLLSRMPSSA